MDLYIGGYAQGKLEYVKNLYPDCIVIDETDVRCELEDYDISKIAGSKNDSSESETDKTEREKNEKINNKKINNKKIKNTILNILENRKINNKNNKIIINNFHLIIKEYGNIYPERVVQNDFSELIEFLAGEYADTIIISDETGRGLVPIDYKERVLRDVTGHILIDTAKHSENVYRIICGIAQKIK